jgi:deoxyxylulose-5-phosphate synthase
VLERLAVIRDADQSMGPVLLHIMTEKGRGYLPAEQASDRMHGVGKYNPKTGEQVKVTTKVCSICKQEQATGMTFALLLQNSVL